jgi:hypothetical protein
MNDQLLRGARLLEIRHDDDLYLRTDKGVFRLQAYGD